MRQKSVKIAPKIRGTPLPVLWGRTPFGRFGAAHVLERFFDHMDYLEDDVKVLREQNREIVQLLDRYDESSQAGFSL